MEGEKLITSLVLFLSLICVCCYGRAFGDKYPPDYPQRTAFACEGNLLVLDCEKDHVIRIIRANYGRFTLSVCNEWAVTDGWNLQCMALQSRTVVSERCDGWMQCTLMASNAEFGGDPCPQTSKYMEIQYYCEPDENLARRTTTTQTTTTLSTTPSSTTGRISTILTKHIPSTNIITSSSKHNFSPTSVSKNNTQYSSKDRSGHVHPINPEKGQQSKTPSVFFIDHEAPAPTQMKSPHSSQVEINISNLANQKNIHSKPAINTHSSHTGVSTTNFRLTNSSTTIVHTPTTIPVGARKTKKPLPTQPLVIQRHTSQKPTTSTTSSPHDILPTPTKAARPPSDFTRAPEKPLPPHPFPNNPSVDTGPSLVCEETKKDGIVWPEIAVGELAEAPCPHRFYGIAFWKCGGRGWIGNPDYSDCVSEWLIDLERVIETHPEEVTEDLELHTEKMELTVADLKKITESMLPRILKSAPDLDTNFDPEGKTAQKIRSIAQNVLDTGDILLSASKHRVWSKLDRPVRHRVAAATAKDMEQAGYSIISTMDPHNATNIEITGENLYMELSSFSVYHQDDPSLKLPTRYSSDKRWSNSVEKFIIPKKNLQQASNKGQVHVVYIVYDHLGELLSPQMAFHSDDQRRPGELMMSDDTRDDSYSIRMYSTQEPVYTETVNSKIMSVSLNNEGGSFRPVQLVEPVLFTLKNINESLGKPKCSYWSYTKNAWSTEGCRVLLSSSSQTQCECDHLTNFAILMDVTGTKLSFSHELSLRIITFVGCIISIVCLLICWITFMVFKNLQCDRNTIHKNLVLCLLIAETVFLCGIDSTHNRLLCAIIAGILHFFFLASFSWMCLEGVQLYVMLIEVFEAEHSRVLWYYLAGYGLPTLVVSVTAGIMHEGYGTEEHCWLSTENYFILSFIGPVSAVMCINLVFLSIAIYMMCKHASKCAIRNQEKTKLEKLSASESRSMLKQFQTKLKSIPDEMPGYTYEDTLTLDPVTYDRISWEDVKAWTKGAIILVVLLGLTWLVGFLFISKETLFMAYVFTILNSLQGLFIFIFHCFMNEKVRKEYRKFVRRCKWLPVCIRTRFGGYTEQRLSTGQNHSSSSGNYFFKFWNSRKRKRSSLSTFAKSTSPTGNGKQRKSFPDMSTTNSYSFPSTANGSLLKSPTGNMTDVNGYLVPLEPYYDECGTAGDLSVVDCSVVDSEFVSEYFQNHLQVSNESRRASTISEEDERPYYELEEYDRDGVSVLSDESTKKRYSFSDSDEDFYNDNYGDDKRASQYENEPLFPRTESERNLLNSLLQQFSIKAVKQYEDGRVNSPSLNAVCRSDDDSTDSKNYSTPNICYQGGASMPVNESEVDSSPHSLPNLADDDQKMDSKLRHSHSVNLTPVQSHPKKSHKSTPEERLSTHPTGRSVPNHYHFMSSEC